MINFVNYKLEINDYVSDILSKEILDFLKDKFDGSGMVIRDDFNNYVLVVNDEVNYSQLNTNLTDFFNKFNLSLVCYKQIFVRKNNKN